MKPAPDDPISERKRLSGLRSRVAAGLRAVLRFPFSLTAEAIKHTAQVVFSIFFLILHPQFKWLLRALRRSVLVRTYIRPALRQIAIRYYEPYFAFLRSLSPFWATISIGVPLAVLEPAKLYATVLIAQSPKIGLVLWLFLQGLGFVLIDKTWTAVRPQSRKIWLVSRLHAWIWLNVSYGKYWVKNSPAYRAMLRWIEQVRRAARVFWSQVMPARIRRR